MVKTLLVGVLLSGASWAVLAVPAQAADMPLKAPPANEDPALWWFHGSVEFGYRDFLNSPQNGYQTANGPTVGVVTYPGTQGRSLAKYYEYSDIKPGVFGNVWMSMGSKDGLYRVDLGGKNIGYDDQEYWLNASKAGQFYFNFGWDQTPHVYSTSALTPYVVNGNAATFNPCVTVGVTTTAPLLARCAQPTDIGIRRDTASASDARWTPDDAWDFRADYSHMDRTGTQVGANSGWHRP